MPLNADCAVPSASEIGEWIAAAYELTEPTALEVHRRGYPLLYRVDSSKGRYWVRIYSPDHPSIERLADQVQAVADLHGRGASTVRPVAARDQRLVQVCDVEGKRWHAVLFTHAPGRGLIRSDMDEVAAFGAALACMHTVSPQVDGKLSEIDFECLAAGPLCRLEKHPAAAAVIDEVRAVAHEMETRLGAGSPIGLCHGDVHLENANIDADGTVTLFDFDELARGPFAYDLACYWRKVILLEHDEQRRAANAEWRVFLNGYQTVRTITDDERLAIPALATLRAIWTMAMPAQYVGIWGDDWLADPTYFAAHSIMISRLAETARTAG